MKLKFFNLRIGLIILHILFAVVGLFTYLKVYFLSENLLIQKTLSKQLILAKSGSLSVENLLNNVKSELSSFIFSFDKKDETAVIDKEQTRAGFISFMQRTQSPVNGIALFDETGKVSILENRLGIKDGEGADFSKAEFIKWAEDPKNKGKVFISTPLLGTIGASKGKVILILAEPIYFGSKFKGTLAIRILVDDFTKAYITPLTSDSTEDTQVINSSGVVMAGRATLLNKNLFQLASTQKWPKYQNFINQLTLALKGTSMQTTWNFQEPKETPQVMLVGISKIDIPDTNKDMYLVVSTPQDSTIALLGGLKRYGLIWLVVGVFTTTIGSFLVIRLQKKA